MSYQFAYGTSTSALSQTTAPATVPGGAAPTAVSAPVAGLSPGTTYYYRLDVSFAGHTYSGAVGSLTTPQIPAVTTGGAAAVTPDGALLGGTVDPSGPQAVSYRFSYGTAPAALTETTSLTRASAGTSTSTVSSTLSGLAPDTTYYFRLDVVLGAQTFSGALQSFTTTIPPPDPVSRGPSWITNTAATLGGLVNPTGFTTSYHFDWGTTAGYGHSTPPVSAGAGSNEIPVSFTVAGLLPSTTYHFRVVAHSAGGTVYGDDQQFTTGATLLGPPHLGFRIHRRVTLQAAIHNGLAVNFSCSAECTVHFAIIMAPGAARGTRLPMNLAHRDAELQTGGSGSARIAFPRSLRRRLRSRRALKLVVSAYAVGNHTRPSVAVLTPLTLKRR